MRALPLAVVWLLASTVAAENCLVPMTVGPDKPPLAFDAASPACRAASDLLVDVAKLRAAAGFAESALSFSVDPDQAGADVYYRAKGVWITVSYLNNASLGREARLTSLAHEIGHGVQDRDGQVPDLPDSEEFAEMSPERQEKHHEHRRRLEAHADAIGQELLLRAGFSSGLFVGGRTNRDGCRGLDGLSDHKLTHPADAQRFVNAAMASGALANDRARRISLTLSSALGGAGPGATAVSELKPAPYVPTARLEDYDGRGRFKPGRLAAESLRVPLAPRGAGPVRKHAALIASAVVDFLVAEPFRAAVDRVAGRDRVAAQVLAACGKPQAAEFAEDFSVLGWTRRIAADAALRAVGARKSRKSPPVDFVKSGEIQQQTPLPDFY